MYSLCLHCTLFTYVSMSVQSQNGRRKKQRIRRRRRARYVLLVVYIFFSLNFSLASLSSNMLITRFLMFMRFTFIFLYLILSVCCSCISIKFNRLFVLGNMRTDLYSQTLWWIVTTATANLNYMAGILWFLSEIASSSRCYFFSCLFISFFELRFFLLLLRTKYFVSFSDSISKVTATCTKQCGSRQ